MTRQPMQSYKILVFTSLNRKGPAEANLSFSDLSFLVRRQLRRRRRDASLHSIHIAMRFPISDSLLTGRANVFGQSVLQRRNSPIASSYSKSRSPCKIKLDLT